MQEHPLHVLVCPLDWGLGHAARCIPVIRMLLENGFKVTIAGYGRSLAMLRNEFPKANLLELPGFSPSYARSGNMVLKMLLLIPSFVKSILVEHQSLKKIIVSHHVDIVISDNRYGLWNKKTRSIFITHQVMIKTPKWLSFSENFFYHISCFLINRFDECWIPDRQEAPGLSGDLSHKYPLPKNARFIGPLSRFDQRPIKIGTCQKKGILVILSGPEPQRSLLEQIIIGQLSELKIPATIICGKPESKITEKKGNITLLPHLSTPETEALISQSELVICRSGYSSIMDLASIGAKALFVPTPGQTEQIYLATLHQGSGTALFREQHQLDLSVDLAKALRYKGFSSSMETGCLAEIIKSLQRK